MTAATTDLLISADSHVIEPHDLWATYADPAFADRVPRLERGPEHDLLVGEDYVGHVGLWSGVLRKGSDVKRDGRWEDDVFPGGYDPAQRLDDLARDNVDAEVLFPTIGLGFYAIEDLDLRWALAQAYNTWLAEFCAYRPKVFHGIGMLIPDDPERAAAEVRRCADLGHVGVMLPLFGAEYDDPAFDVLWAAAADRAMPVNIHSSTYRNASESFFSKPTFVDKMLNTPYQIQKVLHQIVLSGVFDRYPDLVVVSTENDAGWAGHTIERADYWWSRQRSLLGGDDVRCTSLPSEYFRRNIRHAFMRDRTALLASAVIGMDTLMWGNDFPHHISTWPESHVLVDEYRQDLSPADHVKLFSGNVQATYRL